MRTLFMALFWYLLCPAGASAQSTVTAGRAKSVDLSLGYSYINHTAGPSNRVGLNGLDANITFGLSSRFAIRCEVGYARAANVLGTPSHSGVLTYLAGPVFHPATNRNFDPYFQVLLGGARVNGPIPVNGGYLIGGWGTGFAWAVGGGIDYHVSDSIRLRTGLDYLRTVYFGPSVTIQGQNNVKATVAVVYVFGTQRRKRQ